MVEVDLIDFLKDNPEYIGTKDNRLVHCLLGTLYEYKRTGEIKRFYLNRDEALSKWLVLKPTSFIKALRAWSGGSRIARKTDDSRDIIIYEYKGRNLDDINFDAEQILNSQWFIIKDNI